MKRAITRSVRILAAVLRARVSRQMMYRLSFWTAFWVDLLVFTVQLLTFSAIFRSVGQIGGWTLPHMAVFLGTFTILDALYMSTYFFGLLSLPDKIRTGGLDLYLTRPASALFLISFESMDFGTIALAIPGMLMVGWGLGQLELALTPGRVLGYLLLLAMMLLLMFCLMTLMRIPAFWMGRVTAFSEMENALVEFSFRVPGVVYRGIWKLILYVALPYGIMATLPAQAITEGLPPQMWLLAAGVCAGFYALMHVLWRAGLRRYGSASS